MGFSLRTKLVATVAITALAFAFIIVVSELVTRRVGQRLDRIQDHYIPRLELGPQLEADYAALRRAYQDAVSAHDKEALEGTAGLREGILAKVAGARDMLDPRAAATFREALVVFDAAAVDVSRRMMADQSGEELVDAIAAMQQKQLAAQEALSRLVAFDPGDLKDAFAGAHEAQADGARTRQLVMVTCVLLVLLLSWAIARSVVRSVSALQAGFARFGEGSFDRPIAIRKGDDELAEVAEEANRMAASLAKLAKDREVRDWIKTGIVELGHDLRGELDVKDLATRAARYLARYLEAPAAALYGIESDDASSDRGASRLRLLGHHALVPGENGGDVASSFALGEGLIGQAALSSEITVIEGLPENFLRLRSGLGEAPPRCLVLLPLVLDGEVTGVFEIASFRPLSDAARDLLVTARESIAVSLAVARNRAGMRRLLDKTQEQATQLLAQDEELRATNEELRRQQDELRRANEILADHRARLEQKAAELSTVSAYKSEFLANMSHELRTPLNSMLLLSKLLEDNGEGNLTAKQVEYARTVHSAGGDLLVLINQVLDLAKVEAGKQDVKIEAVRLEDIAQRMRRTFLPLAKEKRLFFEVQVEAGLPPEIRSDGQRIAQILTNLLGNAIKFTDHGEVKLVIRRGSPAEPPSDAAARVAFVVSDTGPGIAPEHQGRVFAPFEQVDGSVQRKHGGTGLGLTISREFAALLGGELVLESGVGGGSKFSLLLPENLQMLAPRRDARTPAPAETPREVALAPGTDLLVIEDDDVFAEVLGEIIGSRGLSHRLAKDGETGLRLARELSPRGIILDVTLPDIDGWNVMTRLRSDPTTASIPVHFLTGVDMPERGFAMGAVGYVLKPAERQDLLGVVESLSGERGRSARVLVVEEDARLGEDLAAQLERQGLSPRRVPNGPDVPLLLERERFDCVIIELGVREGRELCFLETVKARAERGDGSLPAVIVYASRPLGRAEAKTLDTYAEAVVLKEGASTARLLDEIRLFVRRLEAGLPKRRSPPKASLRDVRLEGKRILVVDDDMRTVYALSATLRAKGAEVVIAENGAVALRLLAERGDVDAILMDIMMPEMDGFEATRRIREQTKFAKIPIFALTAKAMKGDGERCLNAGATEYLAKPIDPDALLAALDLRIGAHTQRSQRRT